MDDFRGEASMRTWLLTICRRVCLDRLRMRRYDVVSLDTAAVPAARPVNSDDRIVIEAVRGRSSESDMLNHEDCRAALANREHIGEVAAHLADCTDCTEFAGAVDLMIAVASPPPAPTTAGRPGHRRDLISRPGAALDLLRSADDNPVDLGASAIDSVIVRGYRFHISPGLLDPTFPVPKDVDRPDNTVTVWIDGQHLLRRIIVEQHGTSDTPIQLTYRTTMTATLSQHGAPVTIGRPADDQIQGRCSPAKIDAD